LHSSQSPVAPQASHRHARPRDGPAHGQVDKAMDGRPMAIVAGRHLESAGGSVTIRSGLRPETQHVASGRREDNLAASLIFGRPMFSPSSLPGLSLPAFVRAFSCATLFSFGTVKRLHAARASGRGQGKRHRPCDAPVSIVRSAAVTSACSERSVCG